MAAVIKLAKRHWESASLNSARSIVGIYTMSDHPRMC
jgi:hypothetical protein